MGLATALIVAVPRFVINIPIPGIPSIKICCDFIITFLISSQINPVSGAIVAAVSNIIHAFLFPSRPFFPGFTLTDFLSGLVMGYSFKIINRKKLPNISFIACCLSIILSLAFKTFVNTIWFNIIYHIPFFVLIWPRLLSAFVISIIIIPISYKLSKFFQKIIRSNTNNNLILNK